MARLRPLRLTARLIVVLGVAGAALAIPVATLAGDPCYHGFDMPSRSDEATAEIKLAPCAFLPTVARVAPGTTVTFFNGPDFSHLITGAGQAWGDRDVELAPGATISYRFDEPGVYPYACALHRGMSGTIVVGDGGAPGGVATTAATPGGGTGIDSAPIGAALGAASLAALAGLAWLSRRRRRTATGTDA